MILLSHRPEAQPPLLARAAQSIIRLVPLSADETASAGGRPVRASGRQRLRPATGLRRVAGRWQSTVRRGDRPQPGGQGVSSAKAIVGVHGGVRRGGCSPDLHGLLLSRVDRLPVDARRVLQEAAVLGVVFDKPLLCAIAAEAAAADAALDAPGRVRSDPGAGQRPRGQPLSLHARTRARGGLPEPPALPAQRSARAGWPCARAGRRPSSGATERSGGARPSLEPLPRQAQRARAISLQRATGRGRSTPMKTPSATTSARCARSPDCHDCDRPSVAVRERLGDVLAVIGGREALRALRGGAAGERNRRRSAGAGAAASQDWGPALGSRRPRAGEGLLRRRVWSASARTATRSSAPSCSRDRPACVSSR